MCLAAPGRVIEVTGGEALVELAGRRFRTLAPSDDPVRPGDRVVINGGVIVRRVDPDRAAAMDRALGVATGAPVTGPAAGPAGTRSMPPAAGWDRVPTTTDTDDHETA